MCRKGTLIIVIQYCNILDYGTVLWHSVMVQCYGTALWHSVMAQRYGTVLWRSVIVW